MEGGWKVGGLDGVRVAFNPLFHSRTTLSKQDSCT